MASSPQVPEIPLGKTFPSVETDTSEEEPEYDAGMATAETYAILQEATWEAHRIKANIFMAALDRPTPESFVAGQTFPHSFWDESDVEQLKSKFLTFLLNL